MAFHGFLFFVILLCLAWLWHLYWLHHNPLHSKAAAKRTTVQRLLKPRTPRDCPACRLSSTLAIGWGRRLFLCAPGARSKVAGSPETDKTEGFACPNPQCPTSASQMPSFTRLFGDGKHGSAERIQTFRCQACRTTFTARRHTPL